jgi:hypothetical protein
MIGAGPEWIHTRESGTSTNSAGAEAVLDFMFWRSRKHRFGWYLEPSYEYKFGSGHEHSLGVNGGILIAIPQVFSKRDRVSSSRSSADKRRARKQSIALAWPAE